MKVKVECYHLDKSNNQVSDFSTWIIVESLSELQPVSFSLRLLFPRADYVNFSINLKD